MFWDNYDIATLKKEYAAGTPVAVIAAMLNRKKDAVKQKAKRLGLVWGAGEDVRAPVVGMAAPVMGEVKLIPFAEEHTRQPPRNHLPKQKLTQGVSEYGVSQKDNPPVESFKPPSEPYCVPYEDHKGNCQSVANAIFNADPHATQTARCLFSKKPLPVFG